MVTYRWMIAGLCCRAISVPEKRSRFPFRTGSMPRRCGSITRCSMCRRSSRKRWLRFGLFDDAALRRLRGILAQRPTIEIDAPEHRRACVLIPLIRSDAGWSTLFTKRSEQLAAHSGQIAFPGGTVEAGETLDAAAVREAEEEVGIPPQHVELIGRLDDVITHSGF